MSAKDSFGSPSKSSPATNAKASRLPAPTLFVGPPSRNASQLSVSRQGNDPSLEKAARDPLSRQRTALGRQHETDEGVSKDKDTIPVFRKFSEKDIDAKWREMQSTLNEVELTAQSSTQVFGESHATALDDLRKAQIELARAWGRGNEDKAQQLVDNAAQDAIPNRFQGAEDNIGDRASKLKGRRGTEASVSTVLSDESNISGNTMRSASSRLEDETARDIRLASERRAANEAYFKKVDEGVKDVVAKLEVVAEAMRDVESESRSLWSEGSRSSNSTERASEGRAPKVQAADE